MAEKIKQLKSILTEVIDLNYASALLGWDQQVNMPERGAAERGAQLGTLERRAHIILTGEEVGALLEDLNAENGRLDPESDDARLVAVVARHYKKATRVPPDYVVRKAQATTAAHHAWVKARAASDFSIFQPRLAEIVALSREYSEYFAPYDHVYDPLLDDYEPGLNTEDVIAIFAALRPSQVDLVQAISERPQVDDRFLHLPFDKNKQWAFGVEVITRFGYDWTRGRQDLSPHPFTTSFGLDDVRITTRLLPDYFNTGFFATLHECGHGLYEQGFNPEFRRTFLGSAASLAIHESQSRMWENLVGRSHPFWIYFYPRLQEMFPQNLGNISLEAFYKGINKVEPSLIRVEADEATYNLHIMLRLKLEIDLITGELDLQDLPEAWNQGMRDYLGITPPDDAQGVLQDIHWSMGYFGYFSTYALGNLISAQLWNRIRVDLPDLDDQIQRGAFGQLLEWNRENIHREGAKYEPQELVIQVTGSSIDPGPYLEYLSQKYSRIYGID